MRRAQGLGWWPVVLAFVLGIAAAAGQAPLGLWYVTLPALAGLCGLILAQKGQPRLAAWLAFMGGAGYFCAALSWIISPFLVEAETYAWMAPFALLIMGFGLALFWALAVWIGIRAKRPAIALAMGLGAAEFARGYAFGGFPWALLGHIWIDTPMGQMAAYVGPNGLTLLTCILAVALVAGQIWGRMAAVALLAGLWGMGVWTLARPMPADTATIVRLVQPNAEQGMKWDASQAEVFFARLMDATRALPRPDLVIWPETALPYSVEYNPDLPNLMADAAGGATLIYGRQRQSGDLVYNSLVVLPPNGIEGQIYDKHHLTPFGEFIPFGDLANNWFGITAFAAQLGKGFTPGPGPALLDLGAYGQLLPLICYEAVFPQGLHLPNRADWALHITNDAWFGTLTGPYQHAAQARLRAIEQGLPMVRVANTGITAIYDARGRLRGDMPMGTYGYLDLPLPAPLPPTVYAKFGDVIALFLLALGIFCALLPQPRHRY
jgi:apolipoprotein N-acyltransferase